MLLQDAHTYFADRYSPISSQAKRMVQEVPRESTQCALFTPALATDRSGNKAGPPRSTESGTQQAQLDLTARNTNIPVLVSMRLIQDVALR